MNVLNKGSPAIRAAIYARYSSDNQRDESIDAQVRGCKYFAQKSDYVIVSTYIDKAKSGKTTKGRTEFLRMIEDSEKNLFDVVLVHKLNRFGRDGLDTLRYKKSLERLNITLISVTEKLDNTPEGKLMLMVLAGINEFFSATLAVEVMKGLKENALKCVSTGGNLPLGYDIDPTTRKLVINEPEAMIVRLIFEMYASGEGCGKIQKHLNSLGYKTKHDNPFGNNSLYSILRNEKYTGTYIYNKTAAPSADGTRNPRKHKPDDEIIRIEGGCPAIISREVFDNVQIKLASNLKHGGRFKAKEVYLLSSLVYCAECGKKMTGNTRYATRGKSKYASYRCSNKKQGCQNKEIRKEFVDNFALDQLLEKLFSDDTIKKLSVMLNEYSQMKTNEDNTELDTYRKQLGEVNQRISRIIELVSETEISISTVREDLKKLEEQKMFCELQIKAVTDTVRMSAISEETINGLIEQSRDYVRDRNIPECRNFVENYIDRVLVSSEKVTVFFKINTTDGDQGVVPLTSQEDIKNLQSEYHNTVNSY